MHRGGVAAFSYDSKKRQFVPRGDLIPAAPGEGEPLSSYYDRMFSGGASTGSAERIAAVFACVHVIASSIAAMPLHLYRKNGSARERIDGHPLNDLLAGQPNAAMTWTAYREAMLYQLLLEGNQYSRVFWSGGFPREIFPLPPHTTAPKLTDARRVVYEVFDNSVKVPAGTFAPPHIAHFKAISSDGLEGINPLAHCRMTSAGAVALSEYGRASAEQGAPIRGLIIAEGKFKSDAQAADIRRRWLASYRDAAAGHGIPVFEGDGLKWQNVSMTMRDAQFIEQMQFSVEEICRIFNVPPHKVQKLDRATFNNIEHLSREFYMATLVPWIMRIEAVLDQCLLTARERADGLRIRHNADALLRGDLKSRAESYQMMIGASVLTPNEARALEDRQPMEGGDELLYPINHAPLSLVLNPPATPPNE